MYMYTMLRLIIDYNTRYNNCDLIKTHYNYNTLCVYILHKECVIYIQNDNDKIGWTFIVTSAIN